MKALGGWQVLGHDWDRRGERRPADGSATAGTGRRGAIAAALLVLALLASAVGAPGARAGTYDVVACNSALGGANNSWTASYAGFGATSYQCPAGNAETIKGMRAYASASGIDPSRAMRFTAATSSVYMGRAEWRFQAPAGSAIVSIARSLHLHRNSNVWWIGLASHSAQGGWSVVDGYPSGQGPSFVNTGQSFTPVQSVAVAQTSNLSLLVQCTSGCTGSAAASLQNVAVRVQDSSAPSLSVTGGSIAAGDWNRPTADISFDAVDNVGIRVATLSVDGIERARRDFSCDFTRPAPCSNQLNQTLSFDAAGLPGGDHSVRLTVVDTAGNEAHYDRALTMDRTGPELVLDGTLRPEGHSWVGLGDQDLAIDAIDPGSGAVKVTWQVFGTPGIQEQPCPQGGCDLYADVLADTSQQAEGPHTLTVSATDAAGNSSTESWTVKLERTPPTLSLSGSLKAAQGQTLNPGETYSLAANATDSSGAAAQAGLGRLEFAVDDEAPEVAEQPCAAGGCGFSHSFSFVPDDYDEGDHTITVTATDGAGNETTQSFQVITRHAHDDDDDEDDDGEDEDEDEDELECAAPPAPAVSSPTLASLSPQTALDSFRARLPQAFDRWTPVDFAGVVVQPKLDGGVTTEFEATGSVAPMTVDKQISDGATASVQTDDTPICATPRIVSTSASVPTAVINETATLYANSAAATDTLYRPSVGGTGILQQLREPVAPEAFSWHVELEPGQELKQLPDGSVAVVEPVPPDSPIVPTGLDVPPPVPSISARKEALRDTRMHVNQAIDAFDRALETAPDEIVALLPKPWAVDSLDRPVETSLAASGSTVTMQVAHSATSGAYPIITGLELVVGDALDEWVTMEADAQTADYTDADFVAQPALSQALPTPPQDDIPDSEFDFDPSAIDNPSAFEDQDLAAGADETEEVPMAEAGAAPRGGFSATIGLTGSHPAALYSPDRRSLGARAMRPVVPWRITQILDRPRGSELQRRAERKRAFLWDSARGSQPTGYFNIAESGPHGDKTAEERTHGVTTDVALQFAKFKGRRNGQEFEFADPRAPRVWTYRRLLREFLMRYRSVLLDAQGTPTGNLTPWNEPQLRDNPTRQDPVRAARYWAVANALCHPRGGPHLCANVIAGEYSGTRRDQTIERSYRTRSGGRVVRRRSYQRIYHDYLFGRLVLDYPRDTVGERRARPSVWGFHNYDDANRYQRRQRGSRSWPITHRYYGRFRSEAYELRDGSHPRVWITATGVFYHRNCGRPQSELNTEVCVPPAKDKNTVLFGMKSQRDTLSGMLRKLAGLSGPGVGRLYYYTLHDTASAAAYGGPPEVLGRRPQPYDSGLIGSGDVLPPRRAEGDQPRLGDGAPDDHPTNWFERLDRVVEFPRASGFSRSLQPRLAFCALRERVTRRGRPARCSR